MCDDWRNAEQRVVEHWRTRWQDKELDMGPPLLNDLRLVELVEESCGPVSGRSVLEVGAGEGSISVAFADRGATVSLIDSAPKSVEYCLRRLAAFGYQARGQVAVASSLPFADREFDFVVSGGLLEHFEPPLRVRILREMGRVCRGWVVTLIPNGGDGFYDLAKWQLQQTGRWPWGEEHSIASLTEDYSAAGLEMAREVSYDATNSLMLLTDALGLTPEQTQAMTRWAQARGGEPGCAATACWPSAGRRRPKRALKAGVARARPQLRFRFPRFFPARGGFSSGVRPRGGRRGRGGGWSRRRC